MIAWLASYPRSGNTLLRLLCWRVFQVNSSTVYCQDGRSDKLKNEGFVRFAGLEPMRETWLNDADWHLVKTHYGKGHESVRIVTPNGAKVIFVVRDGRAAAVSYNHYLHDLDATHITMAALAASKDWSSMLTKWDPLNSADTLLVRYEDVLTDPVTVISRLAAFLGISPKHEWVNDFGAWKQLMPKFFRSGKIDAWKTEWSPELDSAFMAANGDWMRKLGYS